ncbi:MAG: DUF4476 domain-containing protein [Thiohalospira sp.]
MMKKIVVLTFLTAFATFVFAQTNCNKPLSTQHFQQRYEQIQARTTDNSKLQLASQIVKSFCFSSEQIKEIALLFENDNTRLQFTKVAYNNTTDKENFYEVYDAFIYYSAVFRLHDYINKNTQEPSQEIIQEETTSIDFPNYNYPDFTNYRGQENCDRYISERNFNYIINQINKADNEEEKLSKAKTLIQDNCIPTAFLMKMGSLFSSENNKYEFAKYALQSVYDIDQYIEMQQIFSTPRSRSNFADFLARGQSASNDLNSSSECTVNNNDYNTILNSLKRESYNSTKLKLAKSIIEDKKCLSATQIKGIVDLFDYENSRLEIAMLGFDFTKDTKDYYSIVSQALGFENSKRRLLDYINKR